MSKEKCRGVHEAVQDGLGDICLEGKRALEFSQFERRGHIPRGTTRLLHRPSRHEAVMLEDAVRYPV